MQYDKYPEAYANLSKDDENLFENCDIGEGEFSAAYDEQMGQRLEDDNRFFSKEKKSEYGIRRRDEVEISLATRRLEAERKKQERTQHEELINDNSDLLSSLTELNKDMTNQSDLITYSHHQKVVASAAGMRMIDLKQQRENQLRGYHKSNKDYQEKAIDTEKEEKDADAAANDDGQETKKKKKKKRNKKKKKNAENQEDEGNAAADLPESITDIAAQMNKGKAGKGDASSTLDWEQELANEL